VAAFHHLCPAAGKHIDSHCMAILECLCFESAEFLAAQDSMALFLDSLREPAGQ